MIRYFLHYQGWSKKWDEWVDARRMMVYNEENLKMQKEHNAKKGHSATDASKKLKEKAVKAKENKGKKRKIDSTRELVSCFCALASLEKAGGPFTMKCYAFVHDDTHTR